MSWQPTPDNINALPDGVREFVHDLQTRCDPAGEIARCRLAEDENRMLRAALAKILEHAPESEPTRPEYGGNYDDEYSAGSDREHWRLAEIARAALAGNSEGP